MVLGHTTRDGGGVKNGGRDDTIEGEFGDGRRWLHHRAIDGPTVTRGVSVDEEAELGEAKPGQGCEPKQLVGDAPRGPAFDAGGAEPGPTTEGMGTLGRDVLFEGWAFEFDRGGRRNRGWLRGDPEGGVHRRTQDRQIILFDRDTGETGSLEGGAERFGPKMPDVLLHTQPEAVENGAGAVARGIGHLEDEQTIGPKEAPQLPQGGERIEEVFEDVAAEDRAKTPVVGVEVRKGALSYLGIHSLAGELGEARVGFEPVGLAESGITQREEAAALSAADVRHRRFRIGAQAAEKGRPAEVSKLVGRAGTTRAARRRALVGAVVVVPTGKRGVVDGGVGEGGAAASARKEVTGRGRPRVQPGDHRKRAECE